MLFYVSCVLNACSAHVTSAVGSRVSRTAVVLSLRTTRKQKTIGVSSRAISSVESTTSYAFLPAWTNLREALLEGRLDEGYEATPDVLLQFWHTLPLTEARSRVSECGTER